jgi:hypothetical protein
MSKKSNPKDKIAEWTFMIYMAGDNNLNEDLIRSIYDLHRGVLNATSHSTTPADINKINYLIEFEGNHPNFQTTRYFVGGGTVPSRHSTGDVKLTPIKSPKPTTVKTVAQAISNLVKDGIKEYPASKYGLIISGHSDAFQGRTLLVQENPPGVETIQSIHDELKIVLDDKKKKLNILGFDSCVMNTLEVIYEFRNLTDFWIGSQGSIPNYTWDYYDIAKNLTAKNKDFDSKDIIKVFIEQTQQFNSVYSFDGRSIDISGFDMKVFDNLKIIESFRELNFALINSLIKPFSEMLINDEKGNKADQTLDYSKYPILRMLVLNHWKCQTFMYDQSIDLKDFCKILIDSCSQTVKEIENYSNVLLCPATELIDELKEISNKAKNFLAIFDKEYLKGATVGVDYRFANGVSMFFPWSFLSMSMSIEKYIELDFIKFTEKDEESVGFLWLIFIVIFSILTQRPRPKFESEFITSKIFSEVIIAKIQNLSKTSSTKASSLKMDDVIRLFINGGGGTKDNPPRTRGIDDNYTFYFRRMKNHRSNEKDLTDERPFGKP